MTSLHLLSIESGSQVTLKAPPHVKIRFWSLFLVKKCKLSKNISLFTPSYLFYNIKLSYLS